MLLAAHTLAGAAAGKIIDNPFLAFLIGIIIHFCLDAIPHFDTTDGGKFTVRQIILAGIDFSIGILILIIIFINGKVNFIPVLAGALGGITPDLLNKISFIHRKIVENKIGNYFHQLHTNLQKKDLPIIPGLAVQIAIWIISVYLLCSF